MISTRLETFMPFARQYCLNAAKMRSSTVIVILRFVTVTTMKPYKYCGIWFSVGLF